MTLSLFFITIYQLIDTYNMPGFSVLEISSFIALPVVVAFGIFQLYLHIDKLKKFGPFTKREVELVQSSWIEVEKIGISCLSII